MVVEVKFVGGIKQHTLFKFNNNGTRLCKKNIRKLDDVTNNDVLGFDSRFLFLSTDIIAPILTKLYNVSIEIQSVISHWKLSKVTPI